MAQISQAKPVRLLLHEAISGALYVGHIHRLLQRECITESFLRFDYYYMVLMLIHQETLEVP